MLGSGVATLPLQFDQLMESVDLVVVVVVVIVLGLVFFLYLMFRRSFLAFKEGMNE